MAYYGKFIAVWTMLIMEIIFQISVILQTDMGTMSNDDGMMFETLFPSDVADTLALIPPNHNRLRCDLHNATMKFSYATKYLYWESYLSPSRVRESY